MRSRLSGLRSLMSAEKQWDSPNFVDTDPCQQRLLEDIEQPGSPSTERGPPRAFTGVLQAAPRPPGFLTYRSPMANSTARL